MPITKQPKHNLHTQSTSLVLVPSAASGTQVQHFGKKSAYVSYSGQMFLDIDLT